MVPSKVHHSAPWFLSTPGRILLLSVLLTALPNAASAGVTPPQATLQAEPVRLHVQRVELEQLATDHAELSAKVDITPGADAELKQLRLSAVRLDQTPVYVTPVEGRFVLRAGVPLQLPSVRLVVYYTDLPTPAALDDMLAARHVRVAAEVRAQLQVSALARLLMGDLHPVAALSLDQDAPFERAAVDPGVQAGVSLLGLAQRALGTTASIAGQMTGLHVDVQFNPVSQVERESLLLVRTTFRTRQDAREQICERLGFWISADQVVAPAEVLRPWAYQLNFSEAKVSHLDEVDEASVRTVLLPFGLSDNEAMPRADLSLRDFVVEQAGSVQESRVVSPRGRQVSLLERNSAGNYAVLRLSRPPRTETSDMPLAQLSVAAESTTQALRLFRYRSRPMPNLRALEWDNEAAGEPSGYPLHTLPRPLDATYFGSPVLVNGTIVGMVTGETTWISLPPLRHALAGEAQVTPVLREPTARTYQKAKNNNHGSSNAPHGMAL